MKIDKLRAGQAFEHYVNRYNREAPMIRLKAEHTHRVSALCEEIAESLGLSEEETELAWLIGLLHDVGRFEQQKRYGTFNDAVSIDHAKYGAEILFGERREEQGEAENISIRDFTEDDSEDRVIWTAVYYHSAYRIPENLDERTAMFCNIIRDADKIDILRANIEFSPEQIYNVSSEELHRAAVTKEVMDSFFEGKAVLRSLKKTAVDHIVGHISLVFELVYPRSREIVKKQGYLERMMNFQSDNPETAEQFARIRKRMEWELL